MPILQLSMLTKRAEFLLVQAAPRIGTATLVLHKRKNDALPDGAGRIGYTVTKRCGGAVERNRIKRRLRAAVRQVVRKQGEPGTDYVLVGKPATKDAPFKQITRDLTYALKKHARPPEPSA